jgi:hypothetical protein
MFAGSFETPIEIYEPTMPPQPREEYQIHWRSGISLLVYQNSVIRVRPGVTAASNIPMMKRTARALWYVWQEVKTRTITPQRRQLTDDLLSWEAADEPTTRILTEEVPCVDH